MTNKIQEHYQDALNKFPKNRIIGVFCQGSQNYGLDDENSDLDSKCLVTPSINDFINGQCKCKQIPTYTRSNNEKIMFKDICGFQKQLMIGSPNWIELLFSKYSIINPNYEDLWNKLIVRKEDIAQYNPLQMVKSMNSMIQCKYQNLLAQKTYPSRMYVLKSYPYDPKELSHLIRMYYLLENYVRWNRSFQNNLLLQRDTEQETIELKNWIIEIKRNPSYTYDEAIQLAKTYADKARILYEKLKIQIDYAENFELRSYIKNVVNEICQRSLDLN